MATTRTSNRGKNRASAGTRSSATPDWISTLMAKDPEFVLTVKAEGRTLHEVNLSPNVIRQMASDTHALRSLGPVIREKYGVTNSRRAA
jgi:hypothetical protein